MLFCSFVVTINILIRCFSGLAFVRPTYHKLWYTLKFKFCLYEKDIVLFLPLFDDIKFISCVHIRLWFDYSVLCLAPFRCQHLVYIQHSSPSTTWIRLVSLHRSSMIRMYERVTGANHFWLVGRPFLMPCCSFYVVCSLYRFPFFVLIID